MNISLLSEKEDRGQEKNWIPSKSAFLANGVLGVAVLFFLLALLYAVFLSNHELRWKFLYSAIFGSGLLLFGIALTLPRERKANVALVTASIFLSVYASEAAVAFFFDDSKNRPWRLELKQAAEMAGAPFDSRDKREVVADLRAKGIAAWPRTGSGFFRGSDGLVVGGGRVFPLGLVSRSTIVDCNESGSWSIFESDEHGFRNPLGLYDEGRADVVLIGDSFAQGSCVRDGSDIAGQLRGAGLRTVALGVSHNGPLAELGTLTEYGSVIGPKVVLWMYYEENDLKDLSKEKRVPTLLRYLDDSFSQNLIAKQDLIDEGLKAYITARENEQIRARGQTVLSRIRLAHILKLWHLRSTLLHPLLLPASLLREEELFGKVLAKANERVRNWGGELYFVYLPSVTRYSTGDDGHDQFTHRATILATVRRLGLPIIDFADVLSQHSDPLSVFPFRRTIHYTAEGYKLLGDAILTRLKIDSIVPSPLD